MSPGGAGVDRGPAGGAGSGGLRGPPASQVRCRATTAADHEGHWFHQVYVRYAEE